MSARVFRNSVLAVTGVALAFAFMSPARGANPRQRKVGKVTSTLRTQYRIVQDSKERGTETIEKKIFDDNTILYTMDATMKYGPGIGMDQHVELTVEEESYFPRVLHVRKKVMQPDSTSFEHVLDVEMFSNVAVLSSAMNKQGSSKRVVVPTGTSIIDVGILGYMYQTLFWYDRELGGEQRFQYMDPISGGVSGGVLKLEKEETIRVMGKKSKVSVFQVEREKLGPAKLWVDKQGTIVRGEQNMFTYELVSRKNS
jgi:hypothetical protein